VARILIVGGGCRGRALAAAGVAAGHAVRITTRSEQGCAAIEAAGAECHLGTPARLATLRAALDGATILCWLLAGARGDTEELVALHSTRLEFFMRQAIDTTVRGVIYETSSDKLVRGGELRVRELARTHSIPLAVIDGLAGGRDPEAWLARARAAVDGLLGG
jgi:nucleoside-diphosphate-sugar epimerase